MSRIWSLSPVSTMSSSVQVTTIHLYLDYCILLTGFLFVPLSSVFTAILCRNTSMILLKYVRSAHFNGFPSQPRVKVKYEARHYLAPIMQLAFSRVLAVALTLLQSHWPYKRPVCSCLGSLFALGPSFACMTCSFSFFRSLDKFYFLSESFPYHPVWNAPSPTLPLSFLCFDFFSVAPGDTLFISHIYLYIVYAYG